MSNWKQYFVLLGLAFSSFSAFCQHVDKEYFFTVNGNLYVPTKGNEKGIYPLLWYDKQTDPKFLIGGWGAGLAALKRVKDRVSLKGQANLSRHVYWEPPYQFTDESGSPSGIFQAGAVDYAVGLAANAHYFFKEKFSIGTGLGGQLLLVSLARKPEIDDSKKSIMRNRQYKPLMPVLPLELSYKTNRRLFTIRYEQGLLNRFKQDLKRAKQDQFGLLSFEAGFQLN
jgi:hypothetical protein